MEMEQMFNRVRVHLKNVLESTKSLLVKRRAKDKSLIQWKKPLLISSTFAIIAVVTFLVYQSGFSYQVQLNGEKVAFVKEVNTVEKAIAEVEKEIKEQHGDDAHFEKKVKYEKVRLKQEGLMDEKQLEEIISKKIEVVKPAAIIVIDGQEKLVIDSTQEAQEILEEVKMPYINAGDKEKKDNDKKNAEVLEVSFDQKVNIISKDIPVEDILTKREALDVIGETSEQVQTYQVAKGDSAWNISRSFDMGIRTLEEANPGKDIEKLKPGEEINLVIPASFLDVVTIEKHIKTEKIDYKVEEKRDSSLYKGKKKVKEEGKNGKKEVTMEITFVNGVEKEKEILNEKILEEPKTKVVLVGTKAHPKVSSGKSSRGPAPTYKGNVGSAIVATAKHYIGVPYRHGGSTPSGFDCSGFTSYVYRQYGISLPRSSGAQGGVGGYVSRSNLRPGDLVVFTGHVGIYVGGNSFIHSPRPGKRVQITSLSNSYFSSRFRGGRRVY